VTSVKASVAAECKRINFPLAAERA
jgi:hypothetical protein